VGRLSKLLEHGWEILRTIWSITQSYAYAYANSVTYTYSDTYAHADTDALYGKMCTHAEAAPDARAALALIPSDR
jgi:hypothetical protein